MKRVQAACICQTLHFSLKDDIDHSLAAKQVEEEVKHYKETIEREAAKYKLLYEEKQPDDSYILKIIKQYNNSPIGDYFG